MPLRVCLVTPFAWSQPHVVNDHIAGAAEELRSRGHDVVVLASSNRASDLSAGRRALRRLARERRPLEGIVAVGPAIPVSARVRVGVPLGVQANLDFALTADRFDVVHGHDPALPSLAYLALLRSRTFTVATFHSPERLAYPPGKKQRERLLARVDALTATGADVAEAARARFPGDYRILPLGVAPVETSSSGGPPRFVLEWRPEDAQRLRALTRALRLLPEAELVVLRPALAGRPYVPLALRGRVDVRVARTASARARSLAGAVGFVPATFGSRRLRVEAEAAGVPVVDPPGVHAQPELLAAATARLAEDPAWRAEQSAAARRSASSETLASLGDELEEIYAAVARRRRPTKQPPAPLADRPLLLADLHTHTEHSHDCSTPVEALLDEAEARGLGAIAITDHNTFAGAREALELARRRPITVIPGEEVKTQTGEVIGLFLRDEIPRGLTIGDTIERIREQGGLVYLPHPFDRLHTIPDSRTLHRHLGEIDVFEVYNSRLFFDAYNDEALRFARKYNLTMGAGSDAHVLQGIGTALLRMRAFETPEEFLQSLRSAQIVRRPKSLVYLQGLKWAAQARERRARAPRAAVR